MNMQHTNDPNRRPNWSQINQWLLWIGLAGAVAWLFFGHGEHLLKLAPFLLLLACPLMHVFGHGGHGGHGSHGGDASRDAEQRDDRTPRSGGGHVH